MVDEFVKQLLEAGVHFGHPTKRWNPMMKKFIFGHKNDVYIIDLEKTADCINKAKDFMSELASQGKKVLFVGTKKQAQLPIEEEAKRCGMFYINERWLGGLLTNFDTIKKRIQRLKEIESMKTDGTFEVLTKKEVAKLNKELDRLKKNFSGIVEMKKLPDALFIIDITKEQTALREAIRLNIPTVAIVDTNCNPDLVNYPIPGNDDAMKAVKLITSVIASSITEGKNRSESSQAAEMTEEEKEEKRKEEEIKNKEIEEIIEEVEEDDSDEESKSAKSRAEKDDEDEE